MQYSKEIEIYLGEPFNDWFELSVKFSYQKGEPQIIKADPNDCQQGSADEIEIILITYQEEYAGLLLNMTGFESRLKQLCMESLEDE